MRFTLDILGAELIDIRFNEPNPRQQVTPPLGFTTELDQEDK